MRQCTDNIFDKIIKAMVESIDEGGHGPVLPLTMTVSVGSEYGRHRLVVLVEHLAVVLRARLRRNNGSRFNDDTSTNSIVPQPVSTGTRHRHMDAQHQDEEAFREDLRRESRKVKKAMTRQMRSAALPLAPKHQPAHHSMARCCGRWRHCRHRCRPAIAFSACRRKGGEGRRPSHRIHRSPPHCRTVASPPSLTTIPLWVLCL